VFLTTCVARGLLIEMEASVQNEGSVEKRANEHTLEVSVPTVTKFKKKLSRSSKAALSLSISRIDQRLRHGRLAKQRVSGTASTYLTATVETVVKDILKKANAVAKVNASKQITLRHIQLAVAHNDDLNKVLGKVSVGSRKAIPPILDWILTVDQQKKRQEKNSKK